jgi:hypothetical protein
VPDGLGAIGPVMAFLSFGLFCPCAWSPLAALLMALGVGIVSWSRRLISWAGGHSVGHRRAVGRAWRMASGVVMALGVTAMLTLLTPSSALCRHASADDPGTAVSQIDSPTQRARAPDRRAAGLGRGPPMSRISRLDDAAA